MIEIKLLLHKRTYHYKQNTYIHHVLFGLSPTVIIYCLNQHFQELLSTSCIKECFRSYYATSCGRHIVSPSGPADGQFVIVDKIMDE